MKFVEFVGGPYDGHKHYTYSSYLTPQAALPVSRNLIAAVGGEETGPLLPASSVAIYVLMYRAEGPFYSFAGQTRAETHHV